MPARESPCSLSLDFLIYGDEVHSSAALTIPHPLMHERRFVMEPFVEIAPDFVHPMLNRTARQILDTSARRRMTGTKDFAARD